MNLVLTYHRIVPDKRDIVGFFDVTSNEFRRQLQEAVGLWRNAKQGPFLFDGQSAMSPQAPHLVVTFDDGTRDHYELAAPLLEEQSLRGVFYVSTALLGSKGYLTSEQCRELQARGHAIESHGHSHIPVHSIASALLHEELQQSRSVLEAVGGGKLASFAAVGGYVTPALEQAAHAAGLESLRTLQWGYNQRACFLWESINVNRGNAGGLFSSVASPKWLALKKLLHFAKETAKQSHLKTFYYQIRDKFVLQGHKI